MKIKVEENALVVLVGAMGTGKSSFCSRVFSNHQVVSTDAIRAALTGDFEDQTHNSEVFKILFSTLEVRIESGLFTVVDSTGSQSVLDFCHKLAKKHGRPYYILKFPSLSKEELTVERMKHRMKYLFGYHKQVARIAMTTFPSSATVIELPKNGEGVSVGVKYSADAYMIPDGEYVIVGDLHGEANIFSQIIKEYHIKRGMKIIFLGDLVDRGPNSYGVFLLIQTLKDQGQLYAVPGNHDNKLYRYFKKWAADTDPKKYYGVEDFDATPTYGMKIAHGLDVTLRQFYNLDTYNMNNYVEGFIDYYESLSTYLRLEREGELHIFAHAGVSESMVKGTPLTSHDVSTALYRTIRADDEGMECIETITQSIDKETTVYIHLGHDFIYHQPLAFYNKNNVIAIKHDIGIGKRSVKELPGLYTI